MQFQIVIDTIEEMYSKQKFVSIVTYYNKYFVLDVLHIFTIFTNPSDF